MAGRRDKTKQGSAILRSDQEESQTSEQYGENQPRSNPGRNQNGGTADERKFNLVVDDVPYLIRANPFSFNGEPRFYITINDGDEHVFTWDSTIGRLRAIDDESGVVPEAVEEAISRKLQA